MVNIKSPYIEKGIKAKALFWGKKKQASKLISNGNLKRASLIKNKGGEINVR